MSAGPFAPGGRPHATPDLDANLFETAERFSQSGLSVIPIRADGSKAPSVDRWKPFQATAAKTADIKRMFVGPCGIAVICGAVSGGLEVLDIEASAPHQELFQLVEDSIPGLLDRLPRVRTPSGGFHLFYRCPGPIAGSQKLAQEPGENGRPRVIIETRGEGAYVVTSPSGPACHHAGKPYRIEHGQLTAIPQITVREQEALMACARSFNSYIADRRLTSHGSDRQHRDGGRPGEDYAARADVVSLLKVHGWSVYGHVGDEVRLRRPGKKFGLSATWNYANRRLLWVFSSNAHPFEPNQGYDPFAVYALLEHNRDFKAAARALASKGYGGATRLSRVGNYRAGKPTTAQLLQHEGAEEMHHDEPDLTVQPCTDAGQADRLSLLHGEDMRFIHEWRRWIVWDGGRWVIDADGAVERLAIETARLTYLQAQQMERDGANALKKHARNSENIKAVRAALDLARCLEGVTISAAELDANRYLLGVKNGTYDLKSGELLDSRRHDLITKAARVAFDPAADFAQDCPTWLRFLVRCMGGPGASATDSAVQQRVAFLQRAVGYSLSGDTSEKVIICLFGPTNSGKTTFLEHIRWMLGDYATEVRIESLLANGRTSDNNAQADMAELRGMRFAKTSEAEEGQRLSESKLKYLTQGGETSIKVAKKYENPTTFVATHKLWFDSNERPNLRATDDSVWQRIKPLEFRFRVPDEEIDRALPAHLKAEGAAILEWAVEGFRLWRQEGLGDRADVQAAREAWKVECDPLAEFLKECCDLDNPNSWTASEDLRRAYESFCDEIGEKLPIGPKSFSARLKARGLMEARRTPSGGSRRRGWVGVSLI